MKTKIKSSDGCNTYVENDCGDDITIWQSDEGEEKDMVVIFDAKMARKMIKAIRKAAEELGWEV
jgi:hypothetical protein